MLGTYVLELDSSFHGGRKARARVRITQQSTKRTRSEGGYIGAERIDKIGCTNYGNTDIDAQNRHPNIACPIVLFINCPGYSFPGWGNVTFRGAPPLSSQPLHIARL